jgi:hypothetical protein
MLKMLHAASLAAGFLVGTALAASAQTAPTPGPTNPTPPNPQAQPGATIVVNPTEQECSKGWSPDMKWTKEQFDDFCGKLKAAK